MPPTTTPSSVGTGGALTVQAAAKVPTKHGAVDAVIKREIPYSKLVSPWKKALKAVPLVGTGLVVVEILEESCIRPLAGVGLFEQCYRAEGRTAPNTKFIAANGSVHSSLSAAVGASQSAYPPSVPWSCATEASGFVTSCSGYSYFFQVFKQYYCGSLPGTQPNVDNGVYWCKSEEIAGYNPVPAEVAESALNNPPSGSPDHVRDKVFKLWEELKDLPDDLPQDARSVDATGLSSPTITPKTPADTSKAGPKTTETTSAGTKVTQETSTITYQGDKTTVTNNTTVTNINNEGDIVDESTTIEQGPTDCEKNPSAIGCLELGEPPSGDIPRKDENWQITAESLPGGACPGGFVWPVPGNPEFSWQPLCDQLPKVRAVVLVLASVLAAWIVVGGFQS